MQFHPHPNPPPSRGRERFVHAMIPPPLAASGSESLRLGEEGARERGKIRMKPSKVKL